MSNPSRATCGSQEPGARGGRGGASRVGLEPRLLVLENSYRPNFARNAPCRGTVGSRGDVRRVAGSVAGTGHGQDDVTVFRSSPEERRAARIAVARTAVAVGCVLAHLEPLRSQGVEATDPVPTVALKRELRAVLALDDHLLTRPVSDDGEFRALAQPERVEVSNRSSGPARRGWSRAQPAQAP